MRRSAVIATCEILLGAVFVWAALWKWSHPEQSVAFLSAIATMPIPTLAIKGVAVAEWALGLWLFSGFRNTSARIVAGVVILLFTGLLVLASLSGVEESCGCLGLGESIRSSLARNAILLFVLAVASAAALSHQQVTSQGKETS